MRKLTLLITLGITLILSGCGYNAMQAQGRADQGWLGRGAQSVPAAGRFGAQSGQCGQGHAAHEKDVLTR